MQGWKCIGVEKTVEKQLTFFFYLS